MAGLRLGDLQRRRSAASSPQLVEVVPDGGAETRFALGRVTWISGVALLLGVDREGLRVVRLAGGLAEVSPAGRLDIDPDGHDVEAVIHGDPA